LARSREPVAGKKRPARKRPTKIVSSRVATGVTHFRGGERFNRKPVYLGVVKMRD